MFPERYCMSPEYSLIPERYCMSLKHFPSSLKVTACPLNVPLIPERSSCLIAFLCETRSLFSPALHKNNDKHAYAGATEWFYSSKSPIDTH